jgi:hypothetical protein
LEFATKFGVLGLSSKTEFKARDILNFIIKDHEVQNAQAAPERANSNARISNEPQMQRVVRHTLRQLRHETTIPSQNSESSYRAPSDPPSQDEDTEESRINQDAAECIAAIDRAKQVLLSFSKGKLNVVEKRRFRACIKLVSAFYKQYK